MGKHAKINIELNDDSSEVVLSGCYDSVINAICAGIKGLVINMSSHPTYKKIKAKSKLNDQEFEDEITYSVLLNILDRLDEHYVMSMVNTKTSLPIDMDDTKSDTDDLELSGVPNIDTYDAFEQFVDNLDKEDTEP